MTARLRELAARREELVRSCAARRAELAACVAGIQRQVGMADSVVGSVRRLTRYKTPLGIAAGLVGIAAPRFAARWVLRMAWVLPLAAEGYWIYRKFLSPESGRSATPAP